MEICGICREDVEGNVNTLITKCGHKFHSSCYIEYVTVSKKDCCPLCRENQIDKKPEEDVGLRSLNTAGIGVNGLGNLEPVTSTRVEIRGELQQDGSYVFNMPRYINPRQTFYAIDVRQMMDMRVDYSSMDTVHNYSSFTYESDEDTPLEEEVTENLSEKEMKKKKRKERKKLKKNYQKNDSSFR